MSKASLFFCLGMLIAQCHAEMLAPAPEQQIKAAAPMNDNLAAQHFDADVIVIGAGMAGITTAYQLVKNSTAAWPAGEEPKVLILEARDRSGGRLLSIPTPYGPIDVGAMWIHDGFPGNPLYDLAVKLNATITQEQNYLSASIFHSNGSYRSDDVTFDSEMLMPWLNDVIDRIDTLRTNPATNSSSQDVPIATIFNDYIAKNNLTGAQIEAANLMAQGYFQEYLAANISQLSALRYGDTKTAAGVDVLIKEGFDYLTNTLKQGLNISYNSPVTAITELPNGDGVSVTLANGTSYTAKYVVTTVSLGVLKAALLNNSASDSGIESTNVNNPTLTFTPPLPESKLKAINDMGMAVSDKVILVYDNKTMFWNDTDFIDREMPDLSGHFAIFVNSNVTLGIPALVSSTGADTARRYEHATTGELLGSVLGVLRSMYGAENVPAPKQFYVTRWGEDPWARGSCAFFATGNDKNITSILAEPVGRVLFAGEATSSEKPTTVLGAYLSGMREAKRLEQLLASAEA